MTFFVSALQLSVRTDVRMVAAALALTAVLVFTDSPGHSVKEVSGKKRAGQGVGQSLHFQSLFYNFYYYNNK